MKNASTKWALVALWLAGGCGEPGSGSDGGSDPELSCSANPIVVTTTTLQAELVNQSCRTGCHEPGGTAPQNMADATATQSMVGQASAYAGKAGQLKMVDPNNPANSSLWLKVLGGGTAGRRGPRGESVGGPMPQGAPQLNETQKQLVKDWICSGAGS